MASKLQTFDDLYPGRFLRCGQLHGKNVTLTVARVEREPLVGDDGKEQMRATMYFAETQMGLVMCKTNGICCRAMFGATLADWIGKRVTLMPDKWNGEDCIRIAGSPDIKADITAEIALPRRKATKRLLRRTAAAATTAPAPEREPGEEG